MVSLALAVVEPWVYPPPTEIMALKSLEGCANLRLLVLISLDEVLRNPDYTSYVYCCPSSDMFPFTTFGWAAFRGNETFIELFNVPASFTIELLELKIILFSFLLSKCAGSGTYVTFLICFYSSYNGMIKEEAFLLEVPPPMTPCLESSISEWDASLSNLKFFWDVSSNKDKPRCVPISEVWHDPFKPPILSMESLRPIWWNYSRRNVPKGSMTPAYLGMETLFFSINPRYLQTFSTCLPHEWNATMDPSCCTTCVSMSMSTLWHSNWSAFSINLS